MTATSRASMLAAYQMVATHGSVNEADPHRLIVMLMDGALTRIAQARGCMERKATAEKSAHLQRAIAIIDELRASLDLTQGDLAAQSRQPLRIHVAPVAQAHVGDKSELLDAGRACCRKSVGRGSRCRRPRGHCAGQTR